VAKAVETGRIGAYWDGKSYFWKEMMEGLANGFRAQWPPMIIAKREEWTVRLQWTEPFAASDEVGLDVVSQVRTEGHEAALAELGLSNHK
jgi:hypothetical protein